MKQTKKITFSAMSIALGVLFMTLGYFIEVFDLTVSALCSVLMVFVFIEIGAPYTFLVWIGTSILGALFFTGSLAWGSYFLVFGIYPILKAYIERTKRIFWIPIKLIEFIISGAALIALSEYVLGIPFFGEVNIPLLEGKEIIYKIFVFVAMIVAFFLYDICLTFAVRFYFSNFRKRISSLLK